MNGHERSELRAEIQALRAIAVSTVVVYHLWPAAMPGGFTGVDVFFAISGFLITAHLLREVLASGRLSLSRFWARRARRLLPAALLTLLVCAATTVLVVPQLYWQQFLTEIGASTVFVQNWQLASNAVDYLAAANRPSPVQHFWSLSAEEQFYAVWPVLIALTVWATRRRAALAVVLVAVTSLSLADSISQTASNPAAAYFITPTRAWEFGAGGLLALLGTRTRLRDGWRAALSWAGLAAIGYPVAAYGTATAFPGSAALVPVLGALAVIYAGMPAARWAPSRLLRVAPVQRLGDISYAVYLWHWPLLVFAPFVIAHPDGTLMRAAVVGLTLVLATLTKVLVEDPVRRSTWLSAKPRMTFAFSAAASAVVAAVLVAGTTHVQAKIHAAERTSVRVVARHPACFGAAARDPARPCENPALRLTVVPAPVAAKDEANAPCHHFRRDGVVSVCDFGSTAPRAKRTIALVGDSHASHWRAPLDAVARARGWRAESITRTSCEFSTATKITPEPTRSRCVRWVKALPGYFREHPEIDTLFVVGITGGTVNIPPGRTLFEAEVNGYRNAWRTLPATITHIVVIRDTPKILGVTADCVDQAITNHERAGIRCALARSTALQADPEEVAARGEHSRRIQALDLTHVFCSPRLCFPVIGGALVFKDLHHFTLVFARTLATQLGRDLKPIVFSWWGGPIPHGEH